jgi:hypothetical protein
MENTPHEHHDTVRLNGYERAFFEKFFGANLKRLYAFRKSVSDEQKTGFLCGRQPYVVRAFFIKGGKFRFIRLTRKKVDTYIKEVEKTQTTDRWK